MYFQTQTSPVAELIESEACEPVGVVLLKNITEFLYHSRLIVGTRNIAVGVELGHYHRLCLAAVKLLEALKAALCDVVYVPYLASAVAVSAPLGNVKGPAPVEGHILVYRPEIRLWIALCELLFHFDPAARLVFLGTACTDDSLDVWRVLVNDLAELHKKVRHALIGSPLCKGEPVPRRFVIDAYHHSAEGTQVLCDSNKMLVGHVGVNRQGKDNVLTVAAHVSHAGERLAVGSSAKTALVGEVVVIGVVPLKGHVRVLHDL